MRKVLIVDAAEDFRSVLADALRGTYAVKTCDNGQDALELADYRRRRRETENSPES